MKFLIYSEVFQALPTLCIGVVVAEGINNQGNSRDIFSLLQEAIKESRSRYQGVNLKEHPAIACYREAFRALGFNPNKFLSSIEALTSRIVKGGEPPSINPAVDLVNSISIKYTLPMGAHDLDTIEEEIAIRYSREGEPFTPLGENEPESVPAGELVYATPREIRTRRWIWRQNDRGKVTEQSSRIFFPIDGFTDANREKVKEAMGELSLYLDKFFGVKSRQYFLDRENWSVEL